MSDAVKSWLPGDPAPAGEPMMENSLGHWVPASLVRPEHKLEDQLVRDLVGRSEALHKQLALFKRFAFQDVRSLLALLGERYKVSIGGARGGVKLHSYDGLLRVTLSVADLMTFGPELIAAKALIDECIVEWSVGANEHIRTIINDAFSVGEGGKLQVDRVLALRRLEIPDEKWRRAMEAIGDALRVVQTREYIRIYRRANREAEFEQVVLDASRV